VNLLSTAGVVAIVSVIFVPLFVAGVKWGVQTALTRLLAGLDKSAAETTALRADLARTERESLAARGELERRLQADITRLEREHGKELSGLAGDIKAVNASLDTGRKRFETIDRKVDTAVAAVATPPTAQVT
jgi:hypothetical protein